MVQRFSAQVFYGPIALVRFLRMKRGGLFFASGSCSFDQGAE